MGFLQWCTRSSFIHELLSSKEVWSFSHLVQTFAQFIPASQKAVVIAHKGEPIEGIGGAGAGELRGPTHRVRNHFFGELWVNMLSVSWASLKDKTIFICTVCVWDLKNKRRGSFVLERDIWERTLASRRAHTAEKENMNRLKRLERSEQQSSKAGSLTQPTTLGLYGGVILLW